MILIYGKGKTGSSVYKFCERHNINAKLVDDKDFNSDILNKVKEIIVSPGIPFYHNIFKLAKKNKIPIISDIEFGYRFYKGKIIAITGTDGKTTTSSLIYKILKDAKKDVYIGGNYGIPFLEIVEKNNNNSIAVLELSSFQLYSIKNFKADISLILNIDTDHLDWHKKRKHYILSKLKIIKNQTKDDLLIINSKIKNLIKGKTCPKTLTVDINKYINENLLKIENIEIDINNLKLKGKHNLENIAFAVLTTLNLGINPEKIKKSVEDFKPIPHRLEFIKNINGIEIYNDAKSTTVHATEKAIQSFNKKIILIIGGINKGSDFSILNKYKNKIKAFILIGRDKHQIKEQLTSDKSFIYNTNIFLENTLEDAVKKAFEIAKENEIVLFSPACASFDMFKNYIDRGEKFKEIVKKYETSAI